jgi:hypothetical protein
MVVCFLHTNISVSSANEASTTKALPGCSSIVDTFIPCEWLGMEDTELIFPLKAAVETSSPNTSYTLQFIITSLPKYGTLYTSNRSRVQVNMTLFHESSSEDEIELTYIPGLNFFNQYCGNGQNPIFSNQTKGWANCGNEVLFRQYDRLHNPLPGADLLNYYVTIMETNSSNTQVFTSASYAATQIYITNNWDFVRAPICTAKENRCQIALQIGSETEKVEMNNHTWHSLTGSSSNVDEIPYTVDVSDSTMSMPWFDSVDGDVRRIGFKLFVTDASDQEYIMQFKLRDSKSAIALSGMYLDARGRALLETGTLDQFGVQGKDVTLFKGIGFPSEVLAFQSSVLFRPNNNWLTNALFNQKLKFQVTVFDPNPSVFNATAAVAVYNSTSFRMVYFSPRDASDNQTKLTLPLFDENSIPTEFVGSWIVYTFFVLWVRNCCA